MKAPLPPDEFERLQAVRRYAILDTPPEAAFERLTRLAARLFDAPIAIVNLVDAERQWFKSSHGLNLRETSRDSAFCAHAILGDELLCVPDATRDERFANSPLVTGAAAIRFYAGALLRTPDGFNVGTLAIMDTSPRELSAAQLDALSEGLSDLAALAVDEMELRLVALRVKSEAEQERQEAARQQQRSETYFRSLIENASDIIAVVEDDGTLRYQSPAAQRLLGYAPGELDGSNMLKLVHPDDVAALQQALARVLAGPDAVQEVEYRFRHRDGSWRVLESTVKTLPADALAHGIVVNSRDVGERKNTEMALQSAKEQLQLVLDTIPGGVSWIGDDLRYQGVNRYLAQAYNVPAENFVGQEIGFLGVSSGYEEFVREFLSGESEQTSFEFTSLVKGVPNTVLITARKYNQGRAAIFVGIDISQRKAIEEALQQAHAELETRVRERTAELSAALDALRVSEDRFKLLTEAIPQQVWTARPDGALDYVNRRVLDYFERTFEQMIGWGWADVIHPDDIADTLARWEQALKTGEVYEAEFRLRHADGAYHWYLVRAMPLRDGEDRIVKWFGTNTDITRRKETTDELQRIETRLQLVLSATPAVFYTAEATEPYRTTFISENTQQQLGYTVGETLSDPNFRSQHIHPDDRPQVLAAMPRLFERDTLSQGYRMRNQAGEYRWIYDEMNLVRDSEGQPHEIVGFTLDVTEHKVAEDALRQSEARKTSIVQSALDCIIGMDHEGRVIEWNPAAVATFGYSQQEAMGQQVAELIVPAALRERHSAGIKRYLTSGESVILGQRIEVPALRADQSEILVELSIAPVPLADPPIFTAYLRDITQRKRDEESLRNAKAEAERANRAKSEFLSRMSHELRTPLNAILGFGQLLQMDDLSDEQHQGIEQILKGGQHLLELINDVLDIARIEAEQQPLAIEPLPVADMLAAALDLVRPLATPRRIELSGEWNEAEGLFVFADRRRLHQVLLNLLSNAVKYNRTGGTVTVQSVPLDAGRLRIAVIDSGEGVAPQDIERLWTPFDRLGAESGPIEGSGLGLALTRRLVEAMNGTISVQSMVGEGSIFVVELPLAAGHHSEATRKYLQGIKGQKKPPLQEIKAGETQAVVLYIEDDPSNFTLVQSILRHRPEIKLLAARRGHLGLELAERHRPDLILLDVNLPDINGEEVLRLLRAGAATREIPVVVVSADATPHQIKRMRDQGADEYLTKPLDVKQFLRALEENLTSKL